MRPKARIVFAILASAALAAPAAGPAWEPATVIAAGRGEKGPWQQNDSRYDYVDDATVAFGAGGSLAVAWVDQKRKDVFFQRTAADGRPIGKPGNVSRSPATFSWQPRIAAEPARPGRIYLLWQEIIFSGGSHGGDILCAASSDGGARFGAPLNLSRSRGGDGKGRLTGEIWSNGSHDLAVAPDGSVLAAWTEYHGALWLARSQDGGATFTAPLRVAGDDIRPARAPSLATGPGGKVYLAWTVGEDPKADIHVAQSDDGGARFGPPLRIGAGPGHADAPRLATDGDGVLHLVYAEVPAGQEGPSRIRYARSPGGVARFGAPRTISASMPGGAGAAYPALATDGRKGLAIVWEMLPAGAARPRALDIVTSSDGGESFSAPAPVPGSAAEPGASNGSQQGLLGKKLAMEAVGGVGGVGGAGRVAVVNSSMLPGERSRIWLIRGRMQP